MPDSDDQCYFFRLPLRLRNTIDGLVLLRSSGRIPHRIGILDLHHYASFASLITTSGQLRKEMLPNLKKAVPDFEASYHHYYIKVPGVGANAKC